MSEVSGDQYRVMIVDDHEVVRRGVVAVIDADARLSVVAEASTVGEAKRRLPAVHPDILVTDLQLPDGTGIDVMNAARQENENQTMLVLTSFNDDAAIRESRAAGASGLLLKSVRSNEIISTIIKVANGETAWPAGGANEDEFDFSAVERRIVEFIGDGLANREIADQLGVAEKTVKNRITGILHKMGLQRRTQVAAWVVARRRADWK